MNTDGQNQIGTAAYLRATVECRPTCGCGQDLDCCSRAHCPRCGSLVAGVQLHPEHVSPAPLGWVA